MILAVLNLQAILRYFHKVVGGFLVITVHILCEAQLIKIGRTELQSVFGGELQVGLSCLEFILFIIGLSDELIDLRPVSARVVGGLGLAIGNTHVILLLCCVNLEQIIRHG